MPTVAMRGRRPHTAGFRQWSPGAGGRSGMRAGARTTGLTPSRSPIPTAPAPGLAGWPKAYAMAGNGAAGPAPGRTPTRGIRIRDATCDAAFGHTARYNALGALPRETATSTMTSPRWPGACGALVQIVTEASMRAAPVAYGEAPGGTTASAAQGRGWRQVMLAWCSEAGDATVRRGATEAGTYLAPALLEPADIIQLATGPEEATVEGLGP